MLCPIKSDYEISEITENNSPIPGFVDAKVVITLAADKTFFIVFKLSRHEYHMYCRTASIAVEGRKEQTF